MEILYTDKDFTVIVKPVGLDSEKEVPEALSGEVYPLHRLDKNVGGVMVYARAKAAAAQFSRMIQEGALVKEYVAMVHGTPPQYGDWQDLLWKDSQKNCSVVVDKSHKEGKESKLKYERYPLTETVKSKNAGKNQRYFNIKDLLVQEITIKTKSKI